MSTPAKPEPRPGPEEVQAGFVADLRALRPALDAWWERMVERHGEEGVWRRWPTGRAGHPRVIEAFRRHWFEIEAINEAALAAHDAREAAPERDEEVLWGVDDEDEEVDVEVQNQADWLIHSIGDEAPDLEELVNGLCYVPIGEDLDEEAA